MEIRELIESANQDLRHQIQALQAMLGRSRVAPELTPFRSWVEGQCHELRRKILENLYALRNYPDSILPELLDETRDLRLEFELVNARFASAVVRGNVDDRLGLLVLRWLHDSTRETSKRPFGMVDGDIAVYPTADIPPVYLLPPSRQRTLLYMPLVFHEYGHTIFAIHQTQMADLMVPFEEEISRTVTNNTRPIADVWRKWWVQELFCDAVGLSIGGPCFLQAFDHYFRLNSPEEYKHLRQILERTHPPTQLRADLLIARARAKARASHHPLPQFEELTAAFVAQWDTIAHYQNYVFDPCGTWQESWSPILQEMIDKMLKLANLRECNAVVDPPDPTAGPFEFKNPVDLCNAAWQVHDANPRKYRGWEKRSVRAYLRMH